MTICSTMKDFGKLKMPDVSDYTQQILICSSLLRIRRLMYEVRHADHITRRYDHDGNMVVNFVIDEVDNLQYETTELRNDMESVDGEYTDNKIYGIADCQRYLVRSRNYSTPDYYGLLNRNGRIVTLPIYTSIEAIGKNLYLCQPDGVIVNNKGEIVK